jgi:hypothetical protein
MRKKDHPMRKKDQEIFRRAVELAGSGKCKDWYDVQERLVEKGYRRAPDLLDGEKIRAILDSNAARRQPGQRRVVSPLILQSPSRGFRWCATRRSQIRLSRDGGRSLRRLIASRRTRLHRASFGFATEQ